MQQYILLCNLFAIYRICTYGREIIFKAVDVAQHIPHMLYRERINRNHHTKFGKSKLDDKPNIYIKFCMYIILMK